MDEIDLEKSVPDGAAKIVQHFTSPAAELEALEEKPEELAAELCALRERLKADKAREERIAAYFKARAMRGAVPVGSYIVEVKESKGRVTLKGEDYERFIRDNMTEAAVEECRAKYQRVGDPVISVSVKKMGGA